MLRLVLLMLLLARIERLLVAWSEWLAADRRLIITVIVAVIAEVAALIATLLKIRLALTKLLLRCRNQAKVVFGVLIIVFSRDRVA